MSLSEEQKKRIEANRIRALELKRQRNQKPVTKNHDPVNAPNNQYPVNKCQSETDSIPSKFTTQNVRSDKESFSQSSSLTSTNGASAAQTSGNGKEISHPTSSTVQQKIEENRKRAIALRATKASSIQQNKSASTSVNKQPIDPPKLLLKEVENKPDLSANQSYDGPVHVAICCLLSKSRFYVSTKFHSQLIAVIKNMPSRSYETETCKWSLKIDEHDQFLQSSLFLRPQVKVEPLPKFILSCLKDSERMQQKIGNSNPLLEKLFSFQKEGVEFVLSLNGRALIADDMGLGKTMQALCVMQEYRDEWPLLIVCPSSLRLTWCEAVTTWLPDVTYADVNVILKGGDVIGKEKVTIFSYDLLTKFNLKKRFKCVIADESHFIKNAKTVRCKAAASILQDTRRCLLLSGTPALSRPIELFSQLQCVNRRMMPSLQEFGLRYCDGKKSNWGWDFTGSSNLEELNIFMSANFMIRRLKKDVLDQLPAKRRKKIVIETKMSKILNAAANSASTASKANYQACLFEYYSETAAAKLPGVISYISELLESETKFLVFVHHKTMLCGVQEYLRKNNVKFILIEGSTPAEKRQEQVERFQSDESYLVALLSLTAANTGFTLTSADTVVFAELFYNPGILQQAEDRVHRIGQQNSVVIHYLVARKTSDDIMWPMIESKLSVLGDMGVGADDFKSAEASNYSVPSQGDQAQTNIMNFFTARSRDEGKEDEDGRCSKKAKLN